MLVVKTSWPKHDVVEDHTFLYILINIILIYGYSTFEIELCTCAELFDKWLAASLRGFIWIFP